MSVAKPSLQKRLSPAFIFISATTAFAVFSAIIPSSAVAVPGVISTRLEQRKAQPTTAGVSPFSKLARPAALLSVQPLQRPRSVAVSTNPAEKKPRVSLLALSAAARPLLVTAKIPVKPVTPAATAGVPDISDAGNTAGPSVLASRSRTQALTATIEKPAAAQSSQERVLLAQLEADLDNTQTRLSSTSQKLSAGQRQLMSFSNTLRSAIIEAGEEGAGLHPFVRVASRYAGTPYVWGGESRYGFDCSGFIIRVMRDLGYKALPHSAAEQFKYGQPVAQALLKPGDIVFFANTYKPGISHVGIYIGKRRFIHAASTRQGTIVSSLDASPYRQKYAGARRLLTIRNKA